jgi:plastocyanin
MRLWLSVLVFVFFVPQVFSSEGKENYNKFEFPRRDFSIITTDEGYYPDKIIVFKGEMVRFFITSVTRKPHCFIIKDHPLFLSSLKGRVSEGQVVFTRAGEYEFYCPGNDFKGKVVVMGKKDRHEHVKKLDKNKRSLSSTPRNTVWMPKEY